MSMSATSALSSTLCVTATGEQPEGVTPQLVEEYAAFGDIARLDMSMSTVLKCFFVTYFDVRCAQLAAMESGGMAVPFPGAEHDFRCVQLSMASPAAKVGIVGGFGQFGEVANVSATKEHLIVEFFDTRSAQRLLAASGGAAAGALPLPSANAAGAVAAATGMAGATTPAAMAATAMAPAMAAPTAAPPTPPVVPTTPPAPTKAMAPTTPTANTPMAQSGSEKTTAPPSPSSTVGADGKNVRSKITTKDFSKFDIHPEKIFSGEDTRTTVMVRNLLGSRARKDFLHFLEICGLSDRYTFFYMPCKEHRDVRAGFAFVNFRTPEDVQRLFVAVNGNTWQQIRSGDGSFKPLAMSYARFQGHDELVSHFSASVVIHERDPEKRPIFKAEHETTKSKDKEVPTPPRAQTSAASPAPKRVGEEAYKNAGKAGAVTEPPSPQPDADTDFHSALQKGILQLSSLIALETGSGGRGTAAHEDDGWGVACRKATPPPPGLEFPTAGIDPALVGA